jgi:hypothetical protein
VPVAGGDLRQHAEDGVAEVAVARDHLRGLAGEEAVCLRVVDLVACDRGGEHLQVGRVHLRVRGHHGGDVDPLLERAPVAGQDRGADAFVALVLDQLDAREVEGPDGRGGAVAGVVVDDVDPVDELASSRPCAASGPRTARCTVGGGQYQVNLGWRRSRRASRPIRLSTRWPEQRWERRQTSPMTRRTLRSTSLFQRSRRSGKHRPGRWSERVGGAVRRYTGIRKVP